MAKLISYLLLFLCFSAYGQEKRLALVIGNANYEFAGSLRNPVNDANDLKEALSKAGFDIIAYNNLNQSGLKRVIDEFGARLKDYDVGLFYYAGHGIQSNNSNYMIPVDANLLTEQHIEYDCVQVNRVLSLMEAAETELKIIILDACRNNPFERSWTRSTSGNGLAFMDAPTGTLIAYATAPGSVALDGSGENGVYTGAILESINIKGITILQMFQNVRMLVAINSNNRQRTWEATSLIGDFYFHNNTNNNNQKPEFIYPEEDALKGDVKSVKFSQYHVMLKSGFWIPTHKAFGSTTTNFSRDGKVLNRISIGEIMDMEINEMDIEIYGMKVDTISWEVFKYISKDKIVSNYFHPYLPTDSTRFSIWEIDSLGVESLIYSSKDAGPFSKIVFTRELNGRLIEKSTYDYRGANESPEWRLISKDVFSYEDNLCMQSESTFFKYEEPYSMQIIFYEYISFDRKGNWIERLVFDNAVPDKPLRMEVKEITYH